MKVVTGTSFHRNTHTHKIFMYHFREFRAPEIHHENLRNPQISMDPPFQPSLSDSDGLPARYLHKLQVGKDRKARHKLPCALQNPNKAGPKKMVKQQRLALVFPGKQRLVGVSRLALMTAPLPLSPSLFHDPLHSPSLLGICVEYKTQKSQQPRAYAYPLSSLNLQFQAIGCQSKPRGENLYSKGWIKAKEHRNNLFFQTGISLNVSHWSPGSEPELVLCVFKILFI